MTWSALVVGLQVLGAFPYTVGRKVQKPKFSVPLFLWSIFLQLFSMAEMLAIMKFILDTTTLNVGKQTMFYSFSILHICMSISPLMIMVNSQKIGNLISDMGSQDDPKLSHERKWLRYNLSALVRIVQFCTIMIIFSYFGVTTLRLFNIFELIYVVKIIAFALCNYFLSLELMEKTFDHCSQRLSKAADDLHRTASSISLENNAEKGSDVFISALHSFQLKVRKVSKY